MNYLLEKIIAGESFNYQEAHSFMMAIEQETLSHEVIAGILVGLQQKGITLDEIQGFRKAPPRTTPRAHPGARRSNGNHDSVAQIVRRRIP